MRYRSILPIILFIFIPLSLFAEENFVGVVSDVENEVIIVTPSETKKCTIGMFIPKGSRVITKDMSRVKIMMNDDSLLVIAPKTEFSIDDYFVDIEKKTRKSVLGIVRGKVMFYVNKVFSNPKSKFEVKTKSSIAGVRGTKFFIESDEREFLGVIDGEVELRREDKAIILTPGKCFDSKKGLVVSGIDQSILNEYNDNFKIKKGKTQVAMISSGTGISGEALLEQSLNGGIIRGSKGTGAVVDRYEEGVFTKDSDSKRDRGEDIGDFSTENLPKGDDNKDWTDISVGGKILLRIKILLPFAKTKR